VLAATALVMHGKNTELSRQIEATTRLSDGKRVRDLLLWDERLWPVDPARIGGDEGIDAWLKTAEDVLGRRAAHEASLAALPPVGATSESLDAAADVAWRREILEALVFDLDALPPRVAAMRARREASAALVETTLAKPREIWARIVAEIAADPRYGGLEIEPILGLVPLGRDPKSGLHEFACARTGRPARRASPDVSIAPKPGDGLVFVLIPPGEFTMGATPPGVDGEIGDPNVDPFASRFEVPKRRVRLDAFLVSKFEMTTAQYNDAALREPSTDGFEMHGLHPATGVSWVDAAATLRRVACDFPTEAQWEYAARGGTTTTWWTGDDPKTLAGAANLLDRRGGPAFASQKRAYDEWLDDGAAAVTVVGSYAPNAFGLHDAIGNVAEWARDEFLSYEADPRDGDGFRQGQDRQPRIIRGGSFETPSAHATCAIRSAARPTTTSLALGLRPIFGLFAPKKAAAAPR
jgi:formylglycine-generating enzyme required for sulfatase activity